MHLETFRRTGVAFCLVFALSRSFVDPAPLGGTADTPTGSVHEDSDVEQLHTLKHTIGNTLAAMKAQAVAHATQVAKAAEATAETVADLAVETAEANRTTALNSPQDTGTLSGIVEETKTSHGFPASSTSVPRPLPPSLVPRGQVEVVHGEHQRQNIQASMAAETASAESGSVSADSKIASGSQPPEQLTLNGQRRAYAQRDLSNAIDRMDKLAAYPSVQYSPIDMAEYVFRTGDEKGVASAVHEFILHGLLTREEAITFLQEVRYNLDYLQTHYSRSKLGRSTLVQKAFDNVERQGQSQGMPKDYQDMIEPLKKRLVIEPVSDIQGNNLIQQSIQDVPLAGNGAGVSGVGAMEVGAGIFPEDADYEELLERLRVADFLYTQYTLEEVIYQLANVMFAQSLARGSVQVQEALQKFTSFLESEAAQGRISIPLEKKVLDVLIASLSDTLTKHPDLVAAAREGLGGPALQPSGRFLQELLMSRVQTPRFPNQESLRISHEPPAQLGIQKYIHGA
ncbi:uncharacterized protein LOC105688588 isoform X1 [Athalia rosae]|uniref:uncharacterized protein LOC105688588 isoform X1 n=1 Tax=Athalia rosae TaxID=37344 RepID=UPI0020333B48|nr:uncharacterized protein LOC105688588 isoform X1 [Athalia rosae]